MQQTKRLNLCHIFYLYVYSVEYKFTFEFTKLIIIERDKKQFKRTSKIIILL